MKIEKLHQFHDTHYAEEWSRKFVPSEERVELFETILSSAERKSKKLRVLELGIGPGYLAQFLLRRAQNISYTGLDFSSAMLAIASRRLSEFENRINYVQADLTLDWAGELGETPDVIVSTWALHDLLSKENIFSVYEGVYKTLPEQGFFINGDFVKPEESKIDYERGRIRPSEHIDMLRECGFRSVKVIGEFEKDLDNPTPSNNYVCFESIK